MVLADFGDSERTKGICTSGKRRENNSDQDLIPNVYICSDCIYTPNAYVANGDVLSTW